VNSTEDQEIYPSPSSDPPLPPGKIKIYDPGSPRTTKNSSRRPPPIIRHRREGDKGGRGGIKKGGDRGINLLLDQSLSHGDARNQQSGPEMVYEHLPAIALILDATGVVLWLNQFAEKSLGYAKEELLGQSFLSMLSSTPEDILTRDLDLDGLNIDPVKTVESGLKQKDGSICWVRLTLQAARDRRSLDAMNSVEKVNSPVFLVVGQEIPQPSDRDRSLLAQLEQLEQKLERSKALLTGVLESSTNGILAVDNNGAVIACNDKFRQLWGLSPGEKEENIESQDALLGAIADQLKNPADFQQKVQQLSAFSNIGDEQFLEFKDGRIWEYSTQPQQYQNQIVGRIWQFQDITERSQTQATLQFTQLSIDRSAQAAFWLSPDGRFSYVNDAACRSLGYSREKLLSMTIFDINPELTETNWRQQWQDLKQRGSFNLKTHQSSSNDRQKPLEVTINYVEFNGEEYGCSFIHQLSQAQATEFALRQQQERQQIIGQIASKIRQSLNASEILQTTVDEVRQILQTDRAIIFRFNPDWSGQVIVESVLPDFSAILNETIFDPCFEARYIIPYQEGRVKGIEDIYTANLNQCHIDLLSQFQVRANLVVPILFNQEIKQSSFWVEENQLPVVTEDSQLWGLLIAHHCRNSRQWQPWEMNILQQLGVHVAIAIQQSSLFEQLQATNKELERLASYDGLTQVANRRLFDHFLEKEWRRMLREESWLSLILCDIDYFKRYNDTYGHPAGDSCLKQVAAAMSAVVKRPADLVARYGGEEFAIILPNTHLSGAIQVGEKIRQQIHQLKIPHEDSLVSQQVTMSLGIASIFPSPGKFPKILIDAADEALYQAKEQGRDRIGTQKVVYVSQNPLDS
jgi:diguanylate cyclase (GGDEF)-like protein/PAS domain S-box-containing protein